MSDENPIKASSPATPEPERASAQSPSTEATMPESQEPPIVSEAPAAPGVMFYEAPRPPKKRGNRAAGIVWAFVGTIAFAIVYALAAVIVLATKGQPVTLTFLESAQYWVPIPFLFVAFVLLVLVLNRSRWWAFILGGLVVAVIVYFGTIGTLLLIDGVVVKTPAQAAVMYAAARGNPLTIAAAIVAREIVVWFGGIIGARGQRVKARNAEAFAAYEKESADTRAEYERAKAAATN